MGTFIQQGQTYYMLKLTYKWVWDFKAKNCLSLPRLWKIKKVIIGEQIEVLKGHVY